jgi:TetR/AcrR family transcriptional regulator, cholesterol catabolism regulator
MIQEGLKPILEKIRQKALEHGIASLSLERIRAYEDIPVDELLTYVNSNEELVEKTLELEREKFMEIFLEYDFEGMNAIDILMIVSKEVSKKIYRTFPFNYTPA